MANSNSGEFRRGSLSLGYQVNRAVEELRRKGEHVLTAAKRALKDGADVIVADMKQLAPAHTGRLKSSIKAESLQDGAIYEFSANAKNPRDNFLYAPIIEFSSWIMVRGKKHKKKNTAFMYPAMEKNFRKVNEMLKTAINNAVEQRS